MSENKKVLNKADMNLATLAADDGLLPEWASERFMRKLTCETKLLGMVTVRPMRAPKEKIHKIEMNDQVLYKGKPCEPLPKSARHCPELSTDTLDTSLFRAECRICDEVLEDNIERQRLLQTILDMTADKIAREMEELLIMGDSERAEDGSILNCFDGICASAKSNVVDAKGAPLRSDVLKQMLMTLPCEYRRLKSRLRFMTATNAQLCFLDSIGHRGTTLGDSAFSRFQQPRYMSMGVEDIPMWPDNLGPSRDMTSVMLFDPKQYVVGFWRNLRMLSDYDIRKGELVIVMNMRMGAKFTEEKAVVKAKNVKVA